MEQIGLIANYDFSSWPKNKLKNIASTNAYSNFDSSIYDGTVQNVGNKFLLNKGTRFNDCYVVLDNSINLGTQHTICFRLKSRDTSDNQYLINGTDNYININTTGERLTYNVSTYSYTINSSLNLKYSLVNVSLVRNDRVLDVYANGIKLNTLDVSLGGDFFVNSLGRWTSDGYNINADIENLKIYNRPLSLQEIKDYHNSYCYPVVYEDFSNYPKFGKTGGNWVREIADYHEIYLMENTKYVNTVINGGGYNTTDWVDSNGDGLADGFGKQLSDASCTIVTGNGFTQNAQRIQAVSAGNLYLTGPRARFQRAYYVSFKYRSSKALSTIIYTTGWAIVRYITGSDLNANTGNAKKVELVMSRNLAGYNDALVGAYIRIAAAVAGDYIEMSEYVIQEIPTLKINNSYLSGVANYTGKIKSNVAYGTWFFDILYQSLTSSVFYINFINLSDGTGYNFHISNAMAIRLYRGEDGGTSIFNTAVGYIRRYEPMYNYKITRTINGLFSMYIKEEGQSDWTLIGSVTDTTYTSSEYFKVSISTGDYVSNIRILPGIIV